MRHNKTYREMETTRADMTDFRRPAYSIRHPENEYNNTQNMSMVRQNEAKYPEYEYRNTQNTSKAGKLIRAQGEQIRRMSAEEYLKNKMESGADGHNKRAATGVPE